MTARSEAVVAEQIALGVLRIAEDGRIWRLKSRIGGGPLRLVQPKLAERESPDGYWRVRMSVGGRLHEPFSHRVIWTVAHGPIPPAIEVNHEDGVRGNNRLSNLELMTPGDNQRHAYEHLDRWRAVGERCVHSRLTPEQVVEIRRRASGGEAKRALARAFGVTPRAIRLIVTGQSWRHEMAPS